MVIHTIAGLTAGVDLSAYQFRFVKLTDDYKVGPVAAAGDRPLGVLMGKPKAGDTVDVAIAGSVIKVKCHGAVSAGANVKHSVVANHIGWAQATTTAGDIVSGVALQDGADEDIINILVETPHDL